jgi:O-antigen ligase
MVLVGVLAVTTPLGDYFHTYHEKEGAESFSGRTLLWKAVLPAIRQRPIIGHGYMSTEFMTFEVNEVGWAAPHLHNGFLEALYSTGVIGLVLILGICVAIPRSLYRALRRTPVTDPAYRIAAGCLSLYVFLLINGFFNSSFGGKATAPFILFLGLVAVGNRLLELAPQPRQVHSALRVTYNLAERQSPKISWSSRQ